jgi:2OG-Fe(II) oxygenase superfamily
MTSTFNIALAAKVEIAAHKLVPGQSIRIHNDYLEGAETHRLVIQLNSGWTSANGGLFVMFSSAFAEDIYRVITPLHNSAVGFAILGNSHHAVSTVHSEARYSLICSFQAL